MELKFMFCLLNKKHCIFLSIDRNFKLNLTIFIKYRKRKRSWFFFSPLLNRNKVVYKLMEKHIILITSACKYCVCFEIESRFSIFFFLVFFEALNDFLCFILRLFQIKGDAGIPRK